MYVFGLWLEHVWNQFIPTVPLVWLTLIYVTTGAVILHVYTTTNLQFDN